MAALDMFARAVEANQITSQDSYAESNVLRATPPTVPRSFDGAEPICSFPNIRYGRFPIPR